MAKFIVEMAARVTQAVIIETYEVEASSPEEAVDFLGRHDNDAELVASYVSDEGDTLTEEVIACFSKKTRKRVNKLALI